MEHDGRDAAVTFHVNYDPQLLEEVVGLEIRRREERGDLGLLQEYHRQADPLYQLTPERREREFAALHRRFFRDLGFEARAETILEGHRRVLARVDSLTFIRALQVDEEGADLGAPRAGRSALVRLRAVLFLSPDDLAKFLDHELTHLRDLVNPEFDHDPDGLAGIPLHRRRLAQERYRVGWAITVDGRLARQGRRPQAGRDQRREELARCFPTLTGPELERLFDTLWENDRPTHRQLMAIVTGDRAREPHQPGAPCPLCGFPTHRWEYPSDGALIEAIRLDVPGWGPGEGLCERCFEGYQMRCPTQG